MALTAEQQAVRRTGIGGSEIAAVAGCNPWSSPIDVWKRKRGLEDDAVVTDAMIRGTLFEQAIIKWYAVLTGHTVTFPGTVVHPQHPLVIATPDGIVEAATRRVLEVKYPSWRTATHWGQPGTDEIPEYYYPQVQWEMAATGLQQADVCVFFGEKPLIYTVPFHREMFEALRDVAERFWHDYVVPGVPPPADGTGACSEWLQDRFPHATKSMLADITAIGPWAERLRQARATRLAAEKEEALAAQNIQALLGEHEGCEGPWGRIMWKNVKGRINYAAAVRQLNVPGEVLEQYRGPTYRRFEPKFFGDEQ